MFEQKEFYKVYSCVVKEFCLDMGNRDKELINCYYQQSLQSGYIYLCINYNPMYDRYGWMPGNDDGFNYFDRTYYAYRGEYKIKEVRLNKLKKLECLKD